MRLNRLTDRGVRTLTKPGRHADGGGLYLVIDRGKRWAFLYQLNGRRREMGLGPLEAVRLAEARQMAAAAREQVARGIDPIEARRAPGGAVSTFAELAEQVIRDLSPGWRGAKTEAGWRRSLLTHAADLGPLPVDQIGTDDVLKVVKPLWTDKPESGAKLRERIELVLDAAKVRGLRPAEAANPARWKGHLALLLPKRKKLTRGHHKALPYREAPGFMARLSERRAMAARALEWTIYTAAREGMTLQARRSEVKGRLWTIPAERMKSGKPFVVPLSDQALAVLDGREWFGQDDLLFPGARLGSALSNASTDRLLGRMGVDATVHGFRSTFRDWAGDCTDHAREVVEAALAHAVGDEVERAYRRGDALEKRRRLLQDWADYLTPPATGGR